MMGLLHSFRRNSPVTVLAITAGDALES